MSGQGLWKELKDMKDQVSKIFDRSWKIEDQISKTFDELKEF